MRELISVIVPIYNTECYLRECVESIMKQTYQNIEIILIDDGSSDHSLAICNDLKDKDSRINVISKENSGVSDTRNLGVSVSKGKYVVFIDSDDYIREDYLEKMYHTAISHHVDVVRCNSEIYDINGRSSSENMGDFANRKLEQKEILDSIDIFLPGNNLLNCYTPLLFMKKEIIPKFNVQLRFMEDTVFYLTLLLNIHSIYFLDEKLYAYRYNEKSASKNVNNSLENIYYMTDSIRKIESILMDQKLHQYSLKDIHLGGFFLVCSKISLVARLGRKETISSLRKICNDSKITDIIFDIDSSKLKIHKKAIYYFMYKKHYFIVYCLLVFSNFIKGR